jgi:hypothetical protein
MAYYGHCDTVLSIFLKDEKRVGILFGDRHIHSFAVAFLPVSACLLSAVG